VVVTSRTHEESPAKVLVDASDGADLLVVGSRGLGGFKGLLSGSMSQQCSLHARCPVVIVVDVTPTDGHWRSMRPPDRHHVTCPRDLGRAAPDRRGAVLRQPVEPATGVDRVAPGVGGSTADSEVYTTMLER